MSAADCSSMCECHQWLWFHVDSVVLFSDSFTMINPVGTSRERRVCGSHADPEAMGIGVGVAGWTRICFGRYSNLGQSEAERERNRERYTQRERALTSLLLHYPYFPSQSLRWDSGRHPTRKYVRFPPCAHPHTHTHTYTHISRGEEM